MAARTTREAARARIRAAFEKALDRVIPAEELISLRGRTFIEWEDQADQFDQAVTTTLLEERAALEETALVERGALGRCPHCGSDRLYLQRSVPRNQAVRTVHGEAELGHQSVRCRCCDRSFSPSGAGLVASGAGAAVTQGVPAIDARGGDSAVRQGGGGAQ